MPKTGKPFSVRMSNRGPLGWVSDQRGYRYQPHHPETGRIWPAIPPTLLSIWRDLSGAAVDPEACLINWYDPAARMGLHQDRDEEDLLTAVVSVSLGDPCLFRHGGTRRTDPTRSVRLASGDVLVIGGASRLCFHGVDRIYASETTLLKAPGRINLTLRRVTPPR
jgi:DNA oxidative demethylase